MLLFIVVLCTVFEAFFTAFEVATANVSRARLRTVIESEDARQRDLENSQSLANGEKPLRHAASRAQRVLELLEKPRRLAFLFLTVTAFCMWTAACVLMWHARAAGWPMWQIALCLLGVLFFAEVLPLLWASRRAEDVALRGARWMSGALRVLDPLFLMTQRLGNAGAHAMGTTPSSGVTTEELRSALATAEEEGVIESDERALLEGAMDFREREVREIMTSLGEVVSVAPQTTLRETLQIALSCGHSRLPVLQNEQAVGVLAAKDILPFLRSSRGENGVARDIMRTPFFVRENEVVAVVLESLRRERSLMAIVQNAQNIPCGLITLEDLLEEIVGPIHDEYDTHEQAPLRVVQDTSSTRCVECDTDVKVREFERFWRETWRESARLQSAQGETPPSSQSLDDFARAFLSASNSESESSSPREENRDANLDHSQRFRVGSVWRALETVAPADNASRDDANQSANSALKTETNRAGDATSSSTSSTRMRVETLSSSRPSELSDTNEATQSATIQALEMSLSRDQNGRANLQFSTGARA